MYVCMSLLQPKTPISQACFHALQLRLRSACCFARETRVADSSFRAFWAHGVYRAYRAGEGGRGQKAAGAGQGSRGLGFGGSESWRTAVTVGKQLRVLWNLELELRAYIGHDVTLRILDSKSRRLWASQLGRAG